MNSDILKRRIDLNDFYETGVASCCLHRSLYERLNLAMKAVTWVDDPEGAYHKVPEFMADLSLSVKAEEQKNEGTMEWSYDRKATKDIFPSVFKSILEDILLSPQLIQWSNVYDFHIVFMDMWDGSEDCPWHWDGTDDTDVIMLAYVNDAEAWKPEWGGQLKVGKRHLANHGLHNDFSDVRNVITLQPQRRSLVFVQNRNPMFVHKPEPLNGRYERKVFTAGIKFSPKKSLSTDASVVF